MGVCDGAPKLTFKVFSLKIWDTAAVPALLATVDGNSETPVPVYIAQNQDFTVEFIVAPKVTIRSLYFTQTLPSGISYVSSTTSGRSGSSACIATAPVVTGSTFTWYSGGNSGTQLSTTAPTTIGTMRYRYTGTSTTDLFWGPGTTNTLDGVVWGAACNSGVSSEFPYCNSASTARWKIGIRIVGPGMAEIPIY